MSKKQLFVISHTHWDREWYSTFQEYRFRLVRLIDKLLDIMEKDPSYAYFHFDGQTVIIEDYLQIRPQNEARLYKLIREGRIVIGPWYVMPESWLCAGESLVANLNRGYDISESIGVKPLNCGYVVDLFGHNAQFPQILRGFGIDNALLFRGIGDYPKSIFNWEAADGASVTVSKMGADRCYSNFYFALRHPFEDREFDIDEMAKRMDGMLEHMDKEQICGIYLMMEGCDHVEAEPKLPELLRSLEARYGNATMRIASFEQYMEAIRAENLELETLKGPLYNTGDKGIHNVVLKNVLSSMVGNKQANDRCETKLSRLVEPMDATLKMIAKNGDLPENANEIESREDFIKHAWTYLLKNHPHDSICGCSLPDVHADCDYRYRQSSYISDTLTKQMKELLAGAICTEGKGKDGALILYNPSQDAYNGVAVAELPMPPANHNNFVFYDQNGEEVRAQVIGRKNRHETVYNSRQLIRMPLYHVLKAALEVSVPAFGYAVFTYDNLLNAAMGPADFAPPQQHPPHHKNAGSLRVSSRRFDTGKITVEAAPDGTLTVCEKSSGKIYSGMLAFEDCGDAGDGWNYVKPSADREVISSFARFSLDADGPNAAVMRITTTLDIPAESNGEGRSLAVVPTEVTNIVTLVRGSGKISVHTEIENKATSHRLRVLFPSFMETDSYYTKTPFNMTKWDISFEGWDKKQRETETFVRASQGISYIGDKKSAIALYARGLYETAVSDDPSRTLALTLFRSFPTLVGGAESGSNLALAKMEFEYCIDIDSSLTPASACVAGESYKLDMFAIASPKHEGKLPAELSFVKFEQKQGAVSLSSFAERPTAGKNGEKANAYVLRFFEASGSEASGRVVFPYEIKSAHYVDLRGGYIGDAKFSGNAVDYALRPYGIASIALDL